MAYTINKTDGTILATVADGQVDTISSDITLIGKNYSGFGEALNENLIKILENFANTSAPENPIRGQIWFDVNELKLKVYNGNGFVPVSSATISNSQPSNLGVGDLWFNDVDKQLYFYDGQDTILLGPAYSQSQGVSGLRVANILDSLNQNRVITYLYNNGILLGIFSKDTFTPKLPIDGFSGTINPGFNAGSLEGVKFYVTASNSDALGGQPASSYVRNDSSNIINGQLILTSNLGLIIGDANQGQFNVSDGNLIIANIASNKDITLTVRRDVIAEQAIKIRSLSRKVNIYEGFSESEVDIGGDLIVQGDLTVNGNLVSVNTSRVLVEDKNLILARQTGITPTDNNAATGGIVVQGATAHSFLYHDVGQAATLSINGSHNFNLGDPSGTFSEGDTIYDSFNSVHKIYQNGLWVVSGFSDALPALASQAFTSSEHINLASGKEFKINGVTVLSGTSLGPGITSIPGVTSFGTQTQFTVDDLFMDNSTIQVTAPNTDLILDINGTGTLNVSSKKITNVANPTSAQDAATKNYVDDSVRSRNIVLSLDISDGISNAGIAGLIEQVAPAAEYEDGTYARVLCSLLVNGTTSLDINPLLSTGVTEFVTPTPGTAFGISSLAFGLATVAAPGILVSRTVKTFQIVTGVWTFVF